MLQKLIRGFRIRHLLHELHRAAKKVQSNARGFTVRRGAEAQQQAASVIAAGYRGLLWRRTLSRIRAGARILVGGGNTELRQRVTNRFGQVRTLYEAVPLDESGIVSQAVQQQREREPPPAWLALHEPSHEPSHEPRRPGTQRSDVAGAVSFATPTSA